MVTLQSILDMLQPQAAEAQTMPGTSGTMANERYRFPNGRPQGLPDTARWDEGRGKWVDRNDPVDGPQWHSDGVPISRSAEPQAPSSVARVPLTPLPALPQTSPDDASWVPGASGDPNGQSLWSLLASMFGGSDRTTPSPPGGRVGQFAAPPSMTIPPATASGQPAPPAVRPDPSPPPPGSVIGGGGMPLPPGASNPFAVPTVAPRTALATPPPASPAPSPAAPAVAPPSGADQFQQFIRALTAGAAAGSKPGLSKIGAVAAGAGGATDRYYTDAQAKKKAETESARERFAQTLAIRKDTRDERGANRSDAELGIKSAEAQRRSAESASKQRLDDVRVKKIIEEMRVDAAPSGVAGLTVKQAQKLNDQINTYGQSIRREFETRPAGEFQAELRRRRDELLRDYVPKTGGEDGGASATNSRRQTQSGSVATDGPGAPAAPAPGQSMNGYRFKGGNPSDRNNWEKM